MSMGHQYHKGHHRVYSASLLRVNESMYVFSGYYLAQISSLCVDVFEWDIQRITGIISRLCMLGTIDDIVQIFRIVIVYQLPWNQYGISRWSGFIWLRSINQTNRVSLSSSLFTPTSPCYVGVTSQWIQKKGSWGDQEVSNL